MIDYLYIIPCVLIAIIFHELAHGLVSYWLGDPTPKENGRLSLNPLRHIDPIGLLCLVIFRVGWAKPVVVNSQYYKNRRLGMFLVAMAGPLTNFIIAFISFLIMGLAIRFSVPVLNDDVMQTFFSFLAIINIGLGVFNLIPIPPLDGSRMLGACLPADAYISYMKFERYGFYIILGLLLVDKIVTLIAQTPSIISVAVGWIYNLFIDLINLILF